MRCFAALALPLLGAAAELPRDFLDWAQQFEKQYGSEEQWQKALENFRKSEEIIQALNAQGDAEYGHTRFSDLSPEEFSRTFLPRPMDAAEGRRGSGPYAAPSGDLPDAVDYRSLGAVTPVKDQQDCGSCWAESAVGNIESRWYLARKSSLSAPVPLSVQQVLECDNHDYACYGGFPKGAFEYALSHGGLASEADYPYNVNGHTICLANQTFNETCGDGMCGDPPLTSYCDQTCRDKQENPAAKINSWVSLPQDEDQIAAAVAADGPVSVAMDAGGPLALVLPWLQFYKRGVANPRCSNELNHGVLIVGFGQDAGKKYWTIKNSWGAKWGEQGYFRLLRGEKKCGIHTMATTAIVDKDAEAIVI